MFASFIKETHLAKARSILALYGNNTLEALKEGKYNLYYEYEVGEGAVYYSAIGRDKAYLSRHYCPYELFFSVSKDGMIKHEIDIFSAALILYTHELEANLGEEEKHDLFGEEYDVISLTAGLSPIEAARKMEDRKSFETFLTKLSKIKEENPVAETNKKYDVRFRFSSSYSVMVGLSIITETGDYEVTNLVRFLDALRVKGNYKLAPKETITVDPLSFRAPYDSAISTFSHAALFYNKSKVSTCEIERAGFLTLLETIIGEPIYVNKKKTTLEVADPVSISLDKKGKPVFNPPFSDDAGKTRKEGKEGIFILDWDNNSFTYHPYGSNAIKETYSYFKDHRYNEFSYIKDLFVSKLLPKISSSLKVANAPKGGKAAFVIRLYISFDEKDRLTFKTTYEENGENVKRKDIKGDYGKSLVEAYEALLLSVGGLEHGNLSSMDDIYDFLTKDLSPLAKLCQIYYEDRLKPNSVKKVKGLRVNAVYKADYLELTLDSDEYDSDTLRSLLQAKKEKKKFVLLKDKTILLDSPEIEEAAEVFDNGDVSIADAPIYRLFSLGTGHLSINTDKEGKKVLKAIKDFTSTEIFLPETLQETLRPYQKDGVRYLATLAEFHLGGILADEMGLGKTLQAIAYLVSSLEEKPSLILCPKAVLYNWQSEITRFSSLDAIIIDGARNRREEIISKIESNRKCIYLVSYDTFRRDADLYGDIYFSTAILDEAQSVKNAFSQRHMSLSKINALHRFALTGTPLENSPTDLWSIYDFLMPGYLGNIDHFNRFINNSDYKDALANLLKPFTLRRKKEDVLKDLPPKTETNIIIQMEEDQRMLYLAYLQKAREEQMGEEGNRLSILSALTRLRQICVDPSSFLDYDSISSKLSYCRDMLVELKKNGHKALVFSSFKTVLMHLKEIMEADEEFSIGIITGDTSGKDRLEVANKFNSAEGGIDAMLVSLKAGGVGLNLVGADMVIHLDPWWNPASESQASDRAHRIGQTRPVTIFRLISKDSIEEKVQALQEAKKDLFDDLVEGSGGVSKLTEEDIRYLLS